jgi:hypothetical protein
MCAHASLLCVCAHMPAGLHVVVGGALVPGSEWRRAPSPAEHRLDHGGWSLSFARDRPCPEGLADSGLRRRPAVAGPRRPQGSGGAANASSRRLEPHLNPGTDPLRS